MPQIIQLIANDKLGKLRENYQNPLPKHYYDAFNIIHKDNNQELVVMVNKKNEVIGTLQLTFIQYLTYKGGIRSQIEAVRIKDTHRGKGIVEKLFKWAIKRSKKKGFTYSNSQRINKDQKR